MWICSIRLTVETKDAPDAGTDSLVQAVILTATSSGCRRERTS